MLWRILMSVYVVPSALSVPFNLMLARHEYHRITRKQQGGASRRGEKPSPLLFIAALLALLFVVMGPLCTLFAQHATSVNSNVNRRTRCQRARGPMSIIAVT